MQLKNSCRVGCESKMSTLKKALHRLKSRPKDYTYTEAKNLLIRLGFEEKSKGKTSGSRVAFYREKDGKIVLLHKPHPEDVMKLYAVDNLIDFLEDLEELGEENE